MFVYQATVDYIVDGDTVDVTIDLGFKIYSKQRIRLNGIDTPERGQPLYAEAKARVTELLEGKTVTLKTYKVSKFGQYLGDFLVDDGPTINQTLINEGLAKPYFGGTKD